MTAKNGEKDKARGIRGKQAQVRLHADRDYLTEVRRDRFPDGSKQIRSHGADTQKIDTQWRETALGKILSQLEEIREAHLTYVNAHTERLKARLAEDEEHKQKLITDMDELREEIILQMSNEISETGDQTDR